MILLALKKTLIQSESKSPHCLKRYLLIYRYLASRIGLVQLQDKIVVRFAHTIYPYSFAEAINVQPRMVKAHLLPPNKVSRVKHPIRVAR